uniref:Uncharacterized protein n=1 Tax=Dunaliella tertiolecta TaxID=3047 RepID=A0A6S8M4U9_DUNTE
MRCCHTLMRIWCPSEAKYFLLDYKVALCPERQASTSVGNVLCLGPHSGVRVGAWVSLFGFPRSRSHLLCSLMRPNMPAAVLICSLPADGLTCYMPAAASYAARQLMAS